MNLGPNLLLRFDDIAENMNWEMMDKCEKIMDFYNLKPVMGVIPNNQDPELLKYPKNHDYKERLNLWDKKGWEIAMHGWSHLYDTDTKSKDYFGYGGRSEFFGHSYEIQKDKIIKGVKKLKDYGLNINCFTSPNHTYDINTFKAIKAGGINIIIDGYGLYPFKKYELKFVPQLFYKILILPLGIQSTQIHINYWNDKEYKIFENFLKKNHKKIVNINYINNLSENKFFSNFTKIFLEYSLKPIRKTLKVFKTNKK